MLKSLKKIFANTSLNNTNEKFILSNNKEEHIFVLKYNNHLIGTLKYVGNEWSFYYSDWFKNQNEFRHLLEFPNKDKEYKTKELWPFFSNRIPSIKQPKMQVYLEKNSNKVNTVDLLEKFGTYSVNNPYKLELTL
ncbi:HipA N-terminal domain-containing protein [Flavobacterium sp.]|jgi:HipA-like protein|uniref:HipA N-terminal domain-containing protein n=1 Tax=Flavobacterium sp. TaxID=239 RepID=UPI0037C0695C